MPRALATADDSEAVAVVDLLGVWSQVFEGLGTDGSEHARPPRVSPRRDAPVDAAPFLGDRPPDTALSLSDSGATRRDRGDRPVRDANSTLARLPLLDEDPRESDSTAPPGEEDVVPFGGSRRRAAAGLHMAPRRFCCCTV